MTFALTIILTIVLAIAFALVRLVILGPIPALLPQRLVNLTQKHSVLFPSRFIVTSESAHLIVGGDITLLRVV